MTDVFKIGGTLIGNEELRERFCAGFAAASGPRVLVHGGGPEASRLQEALGMSPVKIEGRRVTDSETLKVVTMVYAGWCNKLLVSCLQKHGCNAIGLSGCDASVVTAVKRAPFRLENGSVVDFGYVGDVGRDSVNVPLLEKLLDMGLVPVLSPVNHDGRGQLLNTNADTVAASVAAALGGRLLCRFEFDGVYADPDDPDSLLESLNEEEFTRLRESGKISGGMVPKVRTCLDALRGGAAAAMIGKTGICL